MRKDALIYFTGKLAPAFVNLAIIILAVRLLGNAEYGKYSMVFYAAMLIGTLTFGWLQQSILRFLSAHPDEQQLVVNRFFFLTWTSALSGAIIGLFFCIFYFQLKWLESLVVIAYIFSFNLFQFHLTLNQAKRKPVPYAVMEGTYNLIFILLFFLLVFVFNQRVFIVLFVAMVISLLATDLIRITLFRWSRVEFSFSGKYFNKEFAKKVFDFGFPMTIWLFLSYLLNISDRFIIKEFTSYEDVGTYSAIKDFIIKIATFSTIPILLTYHPMIVEKWNTHKKAEAMALIREGLKYCFFIAIAVFIVFLVVQDFFYSHILHLQVTHKIMLSATLVVSAFLWQSAMLLHKPLELLLKPKLMLIAIISALVMNAAANIILVPLYGYPASAVAALISVSTYIIIIFAFLFRFHKQGLLK